VANVDSEKVQSLILGFTPTEHDRLRDVLMEVFKRLPQEDLETLVEERKIRFVLATSSQAIHFPVPQAGGYYLLLLESTFLDWPHPEQVYTVVHEMAHAFLDQKATSVKVEFLADRRVVKWGFEAELEAVPDNYLRGTGIETAFGITRTGIMNEKKGG
jgi:hypothetical protein